MTEQNSEAMTHETKFSFIQEIQTAHPLFIINCEFYGTAQIDENGEVIIKEVYAKDSFEPYVGSQRLAITVEEAQNMEGGEMGKFLGQCRDAARKAYQKQMAR